MAYTPRGGRGGGDRGGRGGGFGARGGGDRGGRGGFSRGGGRGQFHIPQSSILAEVGCIESRIIFLPFHKHHETKFS